MTIRPIDFQGAIFNVQKAEKHQANKTEHNFVLQQQMAEELKKRKELEKTKIVETQEGQGKTVNDKKREEQKKRDKPVYSYNKKKKKEIIGEAGSLDIEV